MDLEVLPLLKDRDYADPHQKISPVEAICRCTKAQLGQQSHWSEGYKCLGAKAVFFSSTTVWNIYKYKDCLVAVISANGVVASNWIGGIHFLV